MFAKGTFASHPLKMVFDGTGRPTMQWILFVNIKKYPDE